MKYVIMIGENQYYSHVVSQCLVYEADIEKAAYWSNKKDAEDRLYDLSRRFGLKDAKVVKITN